MANPTAKIFIMKEATILEIQSNTIRTTGASSRQKSIPWTL